MADQWLSIVEYARTFNVSDMTVRRRIKTGRIKAVLKDGKYFIPVDGEAHLAKERPETSTSPYGRQVSATVRPQVESRQITTTTFDRPAPLEINEKQFDRNNHGMHKSVADQMQQQPRNTPLSERRSSTEQDNRLSTLMSKVGDLDLQIQSLTETCRGGFERMVSTEAQLEAKYRADIIAFESRLKHKDLEIDKLTQKIEDLQLLISILEKRTS